MTAEAALTVPHFPLDLHRLASNKAGRVILLASFRSTWDGVVKHGEVPSSLSEGLTKMGKP